MMAKISPSIYSQEDTLSSEERISSLIIWMITRTQKNKPKWPKVDNGPRKKRQKVLSDILLKMSTKNNLLRNSKEKPLKELFRKFTHQRLKFISLHRELSQL